MMSVSEFKSTCLGLLDRMATTGRPILVTKHGKPLALVSPPPAPARQGFGCMKDALQIHGNITDPLDVTWDALRA